MSDTILKCTTRHVRIFTAVVENNDLILDNGHLTLDIDPDNELSDYSLRKIGSLLEDFIRKLLKDGELSYNPNSRVMNYSMGLPRTQELL